jgi:23S rRNA (cytosine1962-C5)-methyltransferase
MKPSTIAIKLNKVAETAVKKGHPWVFEQSIQKGPDKKQLAGSLCVLFDQRNNKPFAFGLWDPKEIIRIKIIFNGSRLTLDETFWKSQLEKAFEQRRPLLTKTNGYRAIHGENDGFPGMVLDIYDTTGVLKVYSNIWNPYLEALLQLFQDFYKLERIVFRLSRKIAGKGGFPYKEGDVIGNPLEEERIVFEEQGVQFYAYPISGHKTGFFLDQRPNRLWVQDHAKGKSVLDVFSYVGSFGVHALQGGATSLTSIDISQHAMDVAKENLALNNLDVSKWTPMVGDAFEILEKLISENTTFDIVILDPPTFATQQSQIPNALKQYERLADLGASLTKRNGTLILGSCSSRITLEDFEIAHQTAFAKQATYWNVVKKTLHDIDHPVTYPEGLYLKTIIYRKA